MDAKIPRPAIFSVLWRNPKLVPRLIGKFESLYETPVVDYYINIEIRDYDRSGTWIRHARTNGNATQPRSAGCLNRSAFIDKISSRRQGPLLSTPIRYDYRSRDNFSKYTTLRVF